MPRCRWPCRRQRRQAMARQRRRPPATRGDPGPATPLAARASAASTLPRQHEDPRGARRVRAAAMSARGSSPTIATSAARRREPPLPPWRAASSARSSATACRNTTGDGLPQITARRPSANSRPATQAPGVEREALRRHPPRVAMHRDERRPIRELPERDVQVGERKVVACVADHDGRHWLGARVRLVGERTSWPAHSRRASGAASTSSGAPGWCAAVYAAAAEAAVMISAGSTASPVALPNAAARLDAMRRGEVRHDSIRDPAAPRSSRTPRRSLESGRSGT